MLLRAAVLLVMSVLVWPASVLACSCGRQANDLHEALKSAREKAHAIFRGRVIGIEPVYSTTDSKYLLRHRVTFEVSETFKGKVAPRQIVTTYRPDGLACGYLFHEGVEYLVYAGAYEQAGLETSMCSRTQPAKEARVELDSLRSGRLPQRPVALRREVVKCTGCDVHTVAPVLVCGGAESCGAPVSPKVAAAALREGRPFWAYEKRETAGETKVYGMASDGRAFQLVQRPAHAAQEACTQRVHRRWCERLSVATGTSGVRPAVACIGSTSDELLCDETTTRRTSWGPMESPTQARCDWASADTPLCQFDHDPVPLEPGRATSSGMACTPGYLLLLHRCRVVPDAAKLPTGGGP